MLRIKFRRKNSLGAYVYTALSPLFQSGARELERLMWLKHYNVLKWQIAFILGLNADKNTDSMEKASSKSYLKLHSLQKTQWACICISLWSKARGPRIDMF